MKFPTNSGDDVVELRQFDGDTDFKLSVDDGDQLVSTWMTPKQVGDIGRHMVKVSGGAAVDLPPGKRGEDAGKVIEALGEVLARYPDMRVGQLIKVVAQRRWGDEWPNRLFNAEGDELATMLRQLLGEGQDPARCKVIRLEARKGSHVNSPRIEQVGRVVKEGKRFIDVELERRFNGGGRCVARFDLDHRRILGTDALSYHGWMIVGEPFDGVPSSPAFVKEETDAAQ